jgi:hypothetical protein
MRVGKHNAQFRKIDPGFPEQGINEVFTLENSGDSRFPEREVNEENTKEDT